MSTSFSVLGGVSFWKNSGVQVKTGDQIKITYVSGTWKHGPTQPLVGPQGRLDYPITPLAMVGTARISCLVAGIAPNGNAYTKGLATGAQLSAPGDALPNPGDSTILTATTSGALWFGHNDTDYANNSGAIQIVIEQVNMDASVTPDAKSKVYGTEDPTLTGTLEGFQPEDQIVATYARTSGEDVAAGPYTITASLLPATALGRYTITYRTADFTITKAPTSLVIKSCPSFTSGSVLVVAALEATVGSPTEMVGQTVSFRAGSVTASGVTAPDSWAEATLSLAPGQHTVTAHFAGSDNYQESSAAGQTVWAYEDSNFVVWSESIDSMKVGNKVTFWGPQWAKQVTSGEVSGLSRFKGWATSRDAADWTYDASDKAKHPPKSVATHIRVMVATSFSKAGEIITGDIVAFAIIEVNGSTDISNDHEASGTVVAIVA